MKGNLQMEENIYKPHLWQGVIFQNINHIQLNSQNPPKKKNQIQKEQRTWIDISPKRHINGQHIHVRCLTSLITKEMQVKTTLKYHFKSVRTGFIKKTIGNKCWWGCEERDPCYTVGWKINWYSLSGKQHGDNSKN